MKKILSLAALSVLASSLPAYANEQEPQLPDVLLNLYLSGQPTAPGKHWDASMGYLKHHDARLQELLQSPDNNPELEYLKQNAAYCFRAVYAQNGPEFLPKLYQRHGQCLTVDTANAGRDWYYSDSQCQNSLEYKNEAAVNYCVRDFDYRGENYGNSQDLNYVQDAWMPGHHAALPISTLDHDLTELPLLQRNTYKTTYGDRGACHLEMRVYKNADLQNGTPLVMIHGGGWLQRLETARSAETQIAHFTKAGFVVYMPFYRIADELGDAGPACNGVTIEDSKQDIKDAFRWVQANNHKFTQSDKSVRVMGQSAGGHMSVWLAQQFPGVIEKVAPMFPVPDFAHQLKEVQNNEYLSRCDSVDENTLDCNYIGWMITTLTGKTHWDELTGSEPIITKNSLLQAVEADPQNTPAMFITHGMADEIVSVSQALRLCNAVSGDIENGPAQKANLQFVDQREVIQCANGSELHLLEKAGHHFDTCGNGLCDVGGEVGVAAARQTLKDMIEWLK
ncbi:alpha/beta hydrolase [Vibrio nigripulchritudo]|uniref:alpha/beta hydrolase n=1 Tax=Vibrio nigripulchritudo TaxID=28173 RepID=UPI0003B21C17|nr:alpha/beta hydrolase [Vibrio nigripulchritudo]CCN69239.1 putative alpha/beta-Hydrolase [Vibrio nigripulchritudo SFn118]